MIFILISGRTSVGKSNVCNKLHDMIAIDTSFTVLEKQELFAFDFIAHYEKNDKHIVLNSPSDNGDWMICFCQYLDSLTKQKVQPDIIITTIRETNVQSNQMNHMLALLDAIGNGTAKLEKYFEQNITNLSSFAPVTLSHHAFVLHLEKQPVNETNQNKVLKHYWNANADIAKHMLDFAIVRL